jgi:hypothetical protein
MNPVAALWYKKPLRVKCKLGAVGWATAPSCET